MDQGKSEKEGKNGCFTPTTPKHFRGSWSQYTDTMAKVKKLY
jgi:hypothetical protein